MHATGKLAIFIVALTSCVSRPQPYRFGSPMLGMAGVPPISLHGARPADPLPREDPGARRDPHDDTAAIAQLPGAHAHLDLRAPHRLAESAPAAVRTPDDLRGLVGRRDKRDPATVALGWGRELSRTYPEITSGAELVAWAEREHRLYPAAMTIAAGDLVVFDRAVSDEPSDLVAIAINRDARGVVELAYVGGGVVRRGFVHPSRPTLRRDGNGVVVNTYLRHGRRWPPKGTHYLTGELVAHVIR